MGSSQWYGRSQLWDYCTDPDGVLKLTNIVGNKSIPEFCKLNRILVLHVAGKFRFFFHSKNIPSNTYRDTMYIQMTTCYYLASIRNQVWFFFITILFAYNNFIKEVTIYRKILFKTSKIATPHLYYFCTY